MIQLNIMGLRHALEIRDSRLYSIQKMADHTNLSRDTVSNIVRNKTIMLDMCTLSKLAHYFQSQGLTIEVGGFFRWEGEELVSNVGKLIVQLKPKPRDSLIAQETGIPFSRLKNLARGNVKRIYLSDLAALLEFFRKREVEIKLGDLLRDKKCETLYYKESRGIDKKASIPDPKRHDVVLKRVKVNEEYDHLIKKRTAQERGQQSKSNAYVPIIRSNIMMLKHIMILKNKVEYLDRQISQEAQVSYRAVENLMRGDATLFYLSTMGKLAYYFQREGLTIEVGDFFRWKGDELVLNLGSLMTQLDPTPTYEEVHNETGISLFRVEDLVRGNVKRIDLHDFGALLLFFRKRGLSIKLGDLLREEGVDPLPRMFSLSAEEKVRLAEERKALEISRNMVDIGMDVTQIATVTGLNLERIKVLA